MQRQRKYPNLRRGNPGNHGGRPSKFPGMIKYILKLVYTLTLLGYTKVDLANYFEVNVDTIYEWSSRYPEFSEALQRGGINADARVAKSLFHRANGFSCIEEVVKVVNGRVIKNVDTCTVIARTNRNTVLKIRTTKRYPPDVEACKFWLINRQRDKWNIKTLSAEKSLLPENQTVVVNVITDEETKRKLVPRKA